MLNLNFEPFPILRTKRLILKELTLDDNKEIFIQRSHPEIQKYLNRKPAENLEDATIFIEKVSERQKSKLSIIWAITEKTSPKLIGTICLWNIENEKNTAEVGYTLHPDFFKQGIMNEALIEVINYGFTIMRLVRIDAFTHKENTASLNLLARNGFKRNSTLENSLEDQSELEYNQVLSLIK